MKPACTGVARSSRAIRPCHPALFGRTLAASDTVPFRRSKTAAAVPKFSRKLRRAHCCCQPRCPIESASDTPSGIWARSAATRPATRRPP
eukprot:9471066-Pyramimonas_sp.AAC.1